MSAPLNTLCPRLLWQNGVYRVKLKKLSSGTILSRSQHLLRLDAVQRVTSLTHAFPATLVHVLKSEYASKKEKKGKKGTKGEEEDDEQADNVSSEQEDGYGFDISSYTPKFQACLDKLKRDYQTLRLGRANPAILDSVIVECGDDFGGSMPLNKVGQVSIKDPQNLIINVFDPKLLSKVEKAIYTADLNLAPIVEANLIRVPIPKLTAQSRTELIKQATQMEQKAKANSRSVRQNGMKVLTTLKKQKSNGISVDDIKKLEKEIDALTAKYNKEIEALSAAKVLEIKG